jgi:hypothetical protein
MLQRVAIQYMRGYEGKVISVWVKKGTDEYIKYKEGESDRKNGLPHRYINTELLKPDYVEVDIDEVYELCCDDSSILVNNQYIADIFGWLKSNGYRLYKK